jgi:SAM-dependent methyltransferase
VFSERMLAEHLDQRHDLASRRAEEIDRHVAWISGLAPSSGGRILDLGCGPGLYTERLAARGYSCVGVDIGPAAIEHARARAQERDLACEYVRTDLRTFRSDECFDVVMLLYGELNTFPPDDAARIVGAIASSLAPTGTVLLELSTEAGVWKKALRSSSWHTAHGGLFGDTSHLVLHESRWDDDARAAAERWHVIHGAGAAIETYSSSTWLLGDDWIGETLDEVGLAVVGRFGDPAGAGLEPLAELQTLLLRRSTSHTS